MFGFTVATRAWHQLPDIPTGRWEAAGGTLNSLLYVAGGNQATLQDLLVYDPRTSMWDSSATEMPEKLWAPTLTGHGSFLYVVGGKWTDPTSSGNLWRYEPSTDAWTTLAPAPTTRMYHATVAIDDGLFVVGGADPSELFLDSVEHYTVATSTWSALPPMSHTRFAPAAGFIAGKIMVASGGDATWQSSLSSVELYTFSTSSWNDDTYIPTSRAASSSEVVDSFLYVMGESHQR
jgi:N-acetylneuraminic acid mutarotase